MRYKMPSAAFALVCILLLPFISEMADAAESELHATQCVNTAELEQPVNLLPYLYHYVDETLSLESSQLETPEAEGIDFVAENVTAISRSYGTEGYAHWFRFCITNTGQVAQNLTLSFYPPLLREFNFYPQQEDELHYETGNSRPFNTRQLDTPTYDFKVELESQQTRSYYVRIQATYNAVLRAEVWQSAAFDNSQLAKNILFGLSLGAVLGLALYNLLLFYTVRNAASLFFVIFSCTALMGSYFWEGRMQQFVFPQSPRLGYAVFMLNYWAYVAFGSLFSKEYLNLERYRHLNRFALGMLGCFTLAQIITGLTSPAAFVAISGVHSLLTVVFYGLFACYSVLKMGDREGRYYLVALAPLLLHGLFWSLSSIGYLGENFVPFDSSTVVALSMILLGYGVGQSISEEKTRAQQEALEQLRISNELKNSYSAQLEAEIAENTAEIRAMNESLEKQAAQLIEMDTAKSQFFTNISHEFRTPLTLIQGPLEMLREEEADSRKKDSLTNVLRNSKQLQGLIDQLLTLSKFDSDSILLRASQHDLVKVVRNFTSQFNSLAEREGISLKFNADQSTIPIYIDHDKLQMIINNLLSNALKFTPAGGEISVEVKLASHYSKLRGTGGNEKADTAQGTVSGQASEFATDHYAQIRVTDTGCGIVEDHLPHVFDRYFQSQANQLYQAGAGTGVGLALTKELVELHIGQISVSSIEKAGTCFTVLLPLGKAHLNPSEIIESTDNDETHLIKEGSVSEASKPVPSADGLAPTILVVDDNRDMRDYLRGILEKDYQVLEAEDGFAAEEIILEQQPALIITDLMMPGRSGLELITQVRQRDVVATTPIIMLTAKAGQEDRMKGLEASADDYLAKPFDAKELKTRIQNLLIRHQQLKAFYAAGETPAESDSESEDELIVRLKEIVNERLTESDFGVEELAKAVAMSAPTLRRKIAELSNFTPSGFIQHCRLEKARQLSNEGKMRTLAELAHSVGFNQANYFSRLYRKTFNQWPLEKIEQAKETE